MKIKSNKDLSKESVEKFLASLEPEKKTEENKDASSAETVKMAIFYEEFKKQKRNLTDFIKDIRHFTRRDQADALKRNYGTRSIKSKIAFRILDSICDETLNREEEVNLFIFCSKFLTL